MARGPETVGFAGEKEAEVDAGRKAALGKSAATLREMEGSGAGSAGRTAGGEKEAVGGASRGAAGESGSAGGVAGGGKEVAGVRAPRPSLKIPDEILFGDNGKYAYEQQQAYEEKCKYLMQIVTSERDDSGRIRRHGLQPELEDFARGGKYDGKRPYGKVTRDMEKLAQREYRFEEGDEMESWDHALEVLPYAMAEYGAFAAKDGRKALPIWTSRFDDVMAGVDLGLSIPWNGKKEDGTPVRGRVNIAIDTTSSSSTKLICQNKFGRHTDRRLPFMPELTSPVRYAANADGEIIGDWAPGDRMEDPEMLRFVVGVDRSSMMGMLKGDKITTPEGRKKVEYMISRQIMEQSQGKMRACLYLSRVAKAKGETLDKATALTWRRSTRIYEHFKGLCEDMRGPNHLNLNIGGQTDAQQIILGQTKQINRELIDKLK